ncbi:hypothetical protein [Rhodospirillum rubrum]|nr:hypothetical protein [Rhodospirillum rubrum]AEO47282.1 hypothetical protein F11_04060 [Rhodospirillum rubrum F11]
MRAEPLAAFAFWALLLVLLIPLMHRGDDGLGPWRAQAGAQLSR